MAKKTITDVHNELQLVKLDMQYVKSSQEKTQQDVKLIKQKLLDPEQGTIANVVKNTTFRSGAQKALWTIWATLIGIIVKMIFWE